MLGSTKYLNGELESRKWYAVFQRSFDGYGSYDSEEFIRFKTKTKTKTEKKPFPTVPVTVGCIVGVIAILAGVGGYFYCEFDLPHCSKRRRIEICYCERVIYRYQRHINNEL